MPDPSPSPRTPGSRPEHRGTARLRGWIAAAALLVFVYPLLLDIPLLDPDEGMHAAMAQEMVERGDWITPKLLGRAFLDKPILYFWAEAASLRVFGMHEAAVRLPGLLFGLLGALTTGLGGWRLFGRRAGMIAALAYATTIVPAVLAQFAAPDVALVPWVNLALLIFWEAERGGSVRRLTACTIGGGLILGLAILTKGLVGVATVGLAFGGYLLLTRLDRGAPVRDADGTNRPLASIWTLGIVGVGALALAALVAVGWYAAMESRNPGYLHYYFFDRHLRGFATDTQTHGRQPFWYYVPILLGGGLPWIAYLPALTRDAAQRRRDGTAPHRAARLPLVWLVAGALFFTASRSKLVTYVWPLFPALALLATIPWIRMLDGNLSDAARDRLARTFRHFCGAGPLFLPALVLAARLVTRIEVSIAGLVITGLVALTAWCPLWFWRRRQYEHALGAAATSVAAHIAAVLTVVMVPLGDQYSARILARHLNGLDQPPRRVILMDERIGSVVFYLDPALRDALRQGQVVHAPLAKLSEWPQADARTVLALPEGKVAKAARAIRLDEVPYVSAGRWRVYRGSDLGPRLREAATPSL